MNTFDSIGFNFDMLCHTYMLRNYKSALMILLCIFLLVIYFLAGILRSALIQEILCIN
jgi:phage-related holin